MKWQLGNESRCQGSELQAPSVKQFVSELTLESCSKVFGFTFWHRLPSHNHGTAHVPFSHVAFLWWSLSRSPSSALSHPFFWLGGFP